MSLVNEAIFTNENYVTDDVTDIVMSLKEHLTNQRKIFN